MSEEKEIKQVRFDELSDNAAFAWNFHGAAVCLEKAQRGDRTGDRQLFGFFEWMKSKYGIKDRHDMETRKSVWKDDYLAGIKDLHDLGLVELKRTAEAGWEVTAIHWDRVDHAIIMGPRDRE